MAPQQNFDGVWKRKIEIVEPAGKKNKKGKNKKGSRQKKFSPVDLDYTFSNSRPQEVTFGDSLVLVTAPRDGLCLFHSVIKAQSSYYWGDRYLNIDTLLSMVHQEAVQNIDDYVGSFANADDYMFQLSEYLNNNLYDSLMGDIMPYILANILNIKINVVRQEAKGVHQVVEPKNPNYNIQEIYVKLEGRHYDPYVTTH